MFKTELCFFIPILLKSSYVCRCYYDAILLALWVVLIRVGHGLDPSMDWIGLGPMTAILCSFFHLYIFYISN